jgi:methylthioribulose-1-phosphate dehydratase
MSEMSDTFAEQASALVKVATALHARGLLQGTSGNLSAVVNHQPLELAITRSGADKGQLNTSQILSIDENCNLLNVVDGKPSDESPLHVAVVKARKAGAVIHTHSVWATLLSNIYFPAGGLEIEGYEMLKGLHGVTGHEHREWIPILENSQDMTTLAREVGELWREIRTHMHFFSDGMVYYTWGSDLKEAKRHVEILEFLFEDGWTNEWWI